MVPSKVSSHLSTPVRGALLSIAAALITSTVAIVGNVFGAQLALAVSPVEVAVWVPYYQVNDGLVSFDAHSASVGELNPFFFTATGAGTVGFDEHMNPAQRALLPAYKTAAANASVPLIATVGDAMPARGMADVLADAGTRATHVQALLEFALTNGFGGLDLDYESFAFRDGRTSWTATFDAWGAFLQDLSTALHSHGLRLEVSVPPIYNAGHETSSGYWVYNYPKMAQTVDRIKVMAYNYSVSTPGPLAPYTWVSTSIDAALQIVPAERLVLGIPAYGTDWVTSVAGTCPVDPATGTTRVPGKRTVRTVNAAQTAADKGQVPAWDATRRERTFSYVESFGGQDPNGVAVRCNVQRTAWYLDSEAIHQRVALAQSKGLVGVALWAGGYEDAATWTGIEAARAGQTFSAPPPITPSVKSPAVLPPYPQPISSTGPLPARFLDTRPSAQYPTADGQFSGLGTRAAGSVLQVQIAGRGPVPATATAVTLNVTVLGVDAGFVTVYPCGNLPTTSNLNVQAGQTRANSVITRLSPTGTVCIYNQQAADLVVDVFDVLSDSTITALGAPTRLLDTRPAHQTIDGQSSGGGPLPINGVVEVPVAGRGGVSDAAQIAVLNVTAVDAVGPGFLTVWPCDGPRPSTSNVNNAPGGAAPNAVVSVLSANGTVCVYSSNVTDVIIDVSGELNPDAYQPLASAGRLMDTRQGFSTSDGQDNGIGRRELNQTTPVQIGGRVGVADHPVAVVLNVTATEATLPGHLTVYPCDAPRPTASNVNFVPGQTVPNLVVTHLSAAGTVCVFTSAPTQLLIDVFGSLTL